MSAFPILRHGLREGWRGLLGWAAGVVAVPALYLPIYPSIGGDGRLQEIIDALPPELVNALGYDDISSGAGYTQATFFGLLGFALLAIAATAWGSAAIAGAEESGRLELALAHGITRTGYAIESALSVLLRLVLLGSVGFVAAVAMNGPAGLGLDPLHVLAATVALVLLAFLSGAAALAVGAITGRRSAAITAGAAVAVAGYAVNAVANQSPDLQGLRDWSPYGWAFGNAPLAGGFDAVGLIALGVAAVVLCAVATFALGRRDVT